MRPRKNLQTRKNRRKRQITWWFSPRSKTVRDKAIDRFLVNRLGKFILKHKVAISSCTVA